MNINQLKESKFLKKEDIGKGILVTIRSVSQENVAKEGAEPEMKWCIHFNEHEKPMVLNSTNGQLIAAITHAEETDHWSGHRIVLYVDPTISFGGKIIGDIRVREPRNQPKPAPPPPVSLPHVERNAVEVSNDGDDVPF